MNALANVASRLPMVWARCYTAGLAAPLRDRRLAEIRSDTFEHTHDPALAERPLGQAWDILQSFLRGLPDDLRWRAVNTPAGMWIVEVMSLSISLSILGGTFAVAQTSEFARRQDQAGIGIAGAGIGLAFGIWCALSLRASANKPSTFSRAESPSLATATRGDPMALQTFARMSGWLLIVAGLFMSISFAAGAAGGYDYFAGTESLLATISESQTLFIVAGVTAFPTVPLLIPLFVYLFLIARDDQRAWSGLAAGLVGIHVAIAVVGLALFAVLFPIAEDYASASGSTAENLAAQARSFVQLRFLIIQPAGLAMAAALVIANIQLRKAGMVPRWLAIVGYAQALFWMPPVAGEFILVFPLFITWTVATGLVLLRQHSEQVPVAAALPA